MSNLIWFQMRTEGDCDIKVEIDLEQAGIDLETLWQQTDRTFVLGSCSIDLKTNKGTIVFSPGLSHMPMLDTVDK